MQQIRIPPTPSQVFHPVGQVGPVGVHPQGPISGPRVINQQPIFNGNSTGMGIIRIPPPVNRQMPAPGFQVQGAPLMRANPMPAPMPIGGQYGGIVGRPAGQFQPHPFPPQQIHPRTQIHQQPQPYPRVSPNFGMKRS